MSNPSVAHFLQAIGNLTASLTARGIGVVVSDGAPLHIDFVNVTNRQDQLGAAAKSYVDWYMLTQACWQALVGLPQRETDRMPLALHVVSQRDRG